MKKITLQLTSDSDISVKDVSYEVVESQEIKPEDATKAKKKGGLFGDPVLVIE